MGSFLYTRISSLEDLRSSRPRYQLVRIGANVEDYKKAEAFIKLAKKLKIFVCSNYMKTYLVSPKKFTKYVKFSENMVQI